MNYTFDFLNAHVDYVLGDHHRNLLKALAWVDPGGSSSFKNWDVVDSATERDTLCCCSHRIKNVFSIIHKTTGDTMEMGSRCIKRFEDKEKNSKVNRLLNLLKNENIKYCAKLDCDSKTRVRQSVVDQFPDQKEFYHKKCLKSKFKQCTRCDLYEDYDCKCVTTRTCVDCEVDMHNPEEWRKSCISCWKKKQTHPTKKCIICDVTMYNTEEWRKKCGFCWYNKKTKTVSRFNN